MSAPSLPSRSSLLTLYRQLYRAASNFKDYNFRQYARRNVKQKVSSEEKDGDGHETREGEEMQSIARLEPFRRKSINLLNHNPHTRTKHFPSIRGFYLLLLLVSCEPISHRSGCHRKLRCARSKRSQGREELLDK